MMKIVLLLIAILCAVNFKTYAQQVKNDTRPQLLKEDRLNTYGSDNISKLDLLQALEVAGIKIHKFNFGDFDKKYNLLMMVDEYKEGGIVETDTIMTGNTEYHYFKAGHEQHFSDYIDQIKIISKIEDNKLTLHIKSYKMAFSKEITYDKIDDDQFFNIREYLEAKWELNKKIPLMIFASSWEDKKYGFHRFCGVVNLIEGDKDTEELLADSPNYFIVSYKVTEIIQ